MQEKENKNIKKNKSKLKEIELWLKIILFIIFVLGISLFIYSIYNYFSINNDSTIFIGLLTFSLLGIFSSFSYGISYWHKEEHRKQEHNENEKLVNLEYLKAQREDINQTIRIIQEEKKYIQEKMSETKESQNIIFPHIFICNKKIDYLENVVSKIFTMKSKILQNKKFEISFLETLKIRNILNSDLKDITFILKNFSSLNDDNYDNYEWFEKHGLEYYLSKNKNDCFDIIEWCKKHLKETKLTFELFNEELFIKELFNEELFNEDKYNILTKEPIKKILDENNFLFSNVETKKEFIIKVFKLFLKDKKSFFSKTTNHHKKRL